MDGNVFLLIGKNKSSLRSGFRNSISVVPILLLQSQAFLDITQASQMDTKIKLDS